MLKTTLGFWLAWTGLVVAGCGSSGPQPCGDCDVTGLWVGRFQSDETSANGDFFANLTQNGTTLAGTFESSRLDLENAVVSGTQEGGSISFQEGTLSISFEGVVTEDLTASGEYDFAGQDRGKWWASRVQTGDFQMEQCLELPPWYPPEAVAHDGTDFWVVSSGYVVRLNTDGMVLSEFELPGSSVSGLPRAAFIEGSLWYVNGSEIVELDTAGNELSRHEDPEQELSMMGISGVEGEIWVVEYGGDLLQVDSNLNTSRIIESAIRSPIGMGWDGSLMWIVGEPILFEPMLYAVDLSGWVRGYYSLPERPQTGGLTFDLTFDGQSLWVTGENSSICRLMVSL